MAQYKKQKHIKICKYCGNIFKTYKKQIFCSYRCSVQNKLKRYKSKCNYCNKILYIKTRAYKHNKHNFCNSECYKKFKIENSSSSFNQLIRCSEKYQNFRKELNVHDRILHHKVSLNTILKEVLEKYKFYDKYDMWGKILNNNKIWNKNNVELFNFKKDHQKRHAKGSDNMNDKLAIITGVQGQDGSYLAEFLLSKNYLVIGIARRKATDDKRVNFRIDHILDNPNFVLIKGDITDCSFINRIIFENKPAEFYNLAAMSFVQESFNTPQATYEIDGLAVLSILEAIKIYSPKTKLYQASTSELYGDNPNYPYDENSYFSPMSPYAIAKGSAHNFVKVYRDSYKLFVCSGIAFNHESERRGEEFVTQKIAQGVARIKNNIQKEIVLGNIESKRDWGHAEDYVKAMWMMLQLKTPQDFILATGEMHSIKDFLRSAFKYVGINNFEKYIRIDKKYFRPNDVNKLIGNSTKAKNILKWNTEITFEKLVNRMVQYQLNIIK